MTNKLFLLAIVFSLVLSLGIVVACGDDDDDDEATDDDTGGDDDTAADDDCASVYTKMYVDCGYTFTDDADEDILLADVIAWCEADEADYGFDGDLTQCILAAECDDVPDCL